MGHKFMLYNDPVANKSRHAIFTVAIPNPDEEKPYRNKVDSC